MNYKIEDIQVKINNDDLELTITGQDTKQKFGQFIIKTRKIKNGSIAYKILLSEDTNKIKEYIKDIIDTEFAQNAEKSRKIRHITQSLWGEIV